MDTYDRFTVPYPSQVRQYITDENSIILQSDAANLQVR